MHTIIKLLIILFGLSVTLPAQSATIVLHNSYDAASRAFVATCPTDGSVQVIDWYQDDAARYAYVGPPPSAFPTVIVPLYNGQVGTFRQPASWSSVTTALGDPNSFQPETVTNPAWGVGGQTVAENQTLIASNASPTIKSASAQAQATVASAPAPMQFINDIIGDSSLTPILYLIAPYMTALQNYPASPSTMQAIWSQLCTLYGGTGGPLTPAIQAAIQGHATDNHMSLTGQ